jgi:plastocyanin
MLLYCLGYLVVALAAGCRLFAPHGPVSASVRMPDGVAASQSDTRGGPMSFRTIRKASRLGVVFVLLLVFALLAGCGEGNETSTTSTGGTATTAGPGTTGAGNAVQVIMKDRAFDPKEVTIKAGDTVTWVNEDPTDHDVVANNGEFKSELFDQGGTFSFTFATAGTYPYFCSIHPDMTGTVIVE